MLHKGFVTPVGRASYVSILEKKEMPNGDMKYSMALLFDKENKEDITRIKKAIKSAFLDFFGEDKTKHPKVWDNCLRDGDEKDNEAYQGHLYLNLKSDRQPGIVDHSGRPILDLEEQIYSGMYCRVSCNFYGWKNAGKKGVGVGLEHVMKVKDGERLDGRQSVEGAFGSYFEEHQDADEDGEDILD